MLRRLAGHPEKWLRHFSGKPAPYKGRTVFSGAPGTELCVYRYRGIRRRPAGIRAKKVPGLATRQTTTKGGYRGDNINDVGADYRDGGRVCQATASLFYFAVVIGCFCIVFL